MREYPSLIDKRFGKLTVISQLPSDNHGGRRWLCRCDCGGEHTATTGSLQSGRTTNCGCKKSPDLTGQVFGRLTVLGRSDKRSPRGERTIPTQECRCECGAITYKPTDVLKNSEISMCQACQGKYAAQQARKSAGFVGGTQLSKITSTTPAPNSTTGVRGVGYDKRTNRYRARLQFKGKTINLGSYKTLEEAVAVRKRAEEEYFLPFINEQNEKK